MPGRSAIRSSCLLSGGYANCLRDVRREAVDGLWWRIPCAHEPHAGRADEIVETPAFGAHRLDDAHGQVDENTVRFDGSDQFDARQLFDRSGEPAGHSVRMRRLLEPHAVVHDRRPRRGEKTHLRRELTALPATAQKLLTECAIEKYDRFAERQTVLRPAQA